MPPFPLMMNDKRSTEAGPFSSRDPQLWNLLGLKTRTTSGATVNEDTANGIAAYWRGKNAVANSFKSLPCHLYQRLPNKRRKVVYDHPAARLVSDSPSPTWGPARFKQVSMLWRFDWGNFCAEIERTNGGKPVALHPIHTSRVYRHWEGKKMTFKVLNNNGTTATIEPADMLHFMFVPWWDGTWGISPIGVGRNSFGLTVTADEYGGKYFANSALPSVVVTTSDNMEKPERDEFRREWAEIYGGDNEGGVAILSNAPGGTTDVKTISGIPAKDAQFIETRVYQVREMARWLGVPVHKLYDMEHAHYNNLEHSQIDYSTDSVMPHAIEAEEELTRKLLTQRERESGLYFAYNMEGLLRGDMKTRYESHNIAINGGWGLRDEARALEDLEPLPDGMGAVPTVQAGVSSLKTVIEGKPEDDISANNPEKTPVLEPDSSENSAESRSKRDAALRSLLDSALERLVRVARDKVTRALKRPNDYPVWRESFLLEHGAAAREAMEPLFVMAHRDVEIEPLLTEYAARVATAVRAADPDSIGKDNDWIFERLLPQETL